MLLYRRTTVSQVNIRKSCSLTNMAWTILFLIWTSYSEGLRIDISNQGLEVVPRNIDISVSALILDNNILTILNSISFDIYVYLTEITLNYCQTSYIEYGTFDNNDKLVTVILAHCNILQLPQSSGPSTPNIKVFNIYRGYGSTSMFKPPYFVAFTRLQKLNLGGRNFKSFNASILQSNIEGLKTDFIKLITFPDFRNQHKLLSLSLLGNYFSEIPQEHIVTLSGLLSLRVENAKIKIFPNLSHMKKLKNLKISNNNIPLFPREYIKELESLKTVFASYNLVQNMPNISYLPMLKSADFSNNLIRYVSASCLYGLPSMDTLYLNSNRIVLTDNNVMTTGKLYLHDNQLASPPDLYDTMLKSLTFQANPLICDQLLCWLRMWPFDKNLPLLDELRCTSPPSLNRSLVMDIHPIVLECYEGRSYEYYMVLSHTSLSLYPYLHDMFICFLNLYP